MDRSKAFTPEYLAEDIGYRLLSTCIAFLVLDTFFIVLMFISRYMSEDQTGNVSMALLMTSAYLTCCGKIVNAICMVQLGGAGRHLVALPISTIHTSLKMSTVNQIICPLTTSLTKLGVLCLFHQILGRTSRRLRIIINVTFVVVLCVLLVQVLIPFVNCKPFSKMWQPERPGFCGIPAQALWRYLSLPNVITTMVIISIPVPSLYKLHVSTLTKIGVGVVFVVCVMGFIAAVMRFHAFVMVENFNDITYDNVMPMCWTIAESGIYLLAGILPTLRPLLRKVFADVPFEKLLSKSFKSLKSFRTSGSWGNKRGSQMRPKGGKPTDVQKPLPSVPKDNILFSDMSSNGTVMVMMEDEESLKMGVYK
ncbi:hypothetical protein BDV95DRAFT_591018 [Massariosphaeria phaeospora]|uniref:Rhodopsin domain-containing protein n=1 Tax=Massariosphaeria phaeospora TaxID=100035 RepID=A0A7C8MFS6_9PLEO|nr:hypothetical protein BDV95DRAFT_591018 [Massariosphaeria phaeospora]